MTIAIGYDLSGTTMRIPKTFTRIEQNVRIVSIEAKHPNCNRRYIAKPFNASEKRWGVWDQRVGRYLTNAEVEALSAVQIRERWA